MDVFEKRNPTASPCVATFHLSRANAIFIMAYDDGNPQTERSPKLTKLLYNFQGGDKLRGNYLLTMRELADLGVTYIALPGADSLVSNEGHFRPTRTFGPDVNVPQVEPWEKMGWDHKPIVLHLFDLVREMAPDEHRSNDEDSRDDLMGWSGIQYVARCTAINRTRWLMCDF